MTCRAAVLGMYLKEKYNVQPLESTAFGEGSEFQLVLCPPPVGAAAGRSGTPSRQLTVTTLASEATPKAHVQPPALTPTATSLPTPTPTPTPTPAPARP